MPMLLEKHIVYVLASVSKPGIGRKRGLRRFLPQRVGHNRLKCVCHLVRPPRIGLKSVVDLFACSLFLLDRYHDFGVKNRNIANDFRIFRVYFYRCGIGILEFASRSLVGNCRYLHGLQSSGPYSILLFSLTLESDRDFWPTFLCRGLLGIIMIHTHWIESWHRLLFFRPSIKSLNVILPRESVIRPKMLNIRYVRCFSALKLWICHSLINVITGHEEFQVLVTNLKRWLVSATVAGVSEQVE